MKVQKPIKIKELINDGVIKSVYICDENTDILSGFATDLLSHGIDKAQKGDAWLTILTNHNICLLYTSRCV